ncbi:MAG: NUDIX domain-containing protein [Nitrospirales bacterium]|nr:NUDIX domain-containing protein [Nitrospirales bacterium]
MKFCSHCGNHVTRKIPVGDAFIRFVCEQCGMIHYQNPKIVVGCIPEWKNDILLCKRAIEPRLGLWTIPAGFMENHETLEAAAARETFEEAMAVVDITSLFGVFSIPSVSQVYIMFRGTMRTNDYGAGEESLEVGLFPVEAIPWDNLAFHVMHEGLSRYCQDKKDGRFQVHRSMIDR